MQSGYEGIEGESATMIAISGDNQRGVSNLQQIRGTTITYLILADDENDLQTISDYNVLHPVFENIARPATYIIPFLNNKFSLTKNAFVVAQFIAPLTFTFVRSSNSH